MWSLCSVVLSVLESECPEPWEALVGQPESRDHRKRKCQFRNQVQQYPDCELSQSLGFLENGVLAADPG